MEAEEETVSIRFLHCGLKSQHCGFFSLQSCTHFLLAMMSGFEVSHTVVASCTLTCFWPHHTTSSPCCALCRLVYGADNELEREVRISCPDATGLGCDVTRMLLDFGLKIVHGDMSTDGKWCFLIFRVSAH